MIRTRKHYSMLLMFIGTTLILSSCKKDDNDAPDDGSWTIVGEWELSGLAIDHNGDGEIAAEERMQAPSDAIFELTFRENGTGVERGTDEYEGDYEDPFTWELADNNSRVVIHYEDDEEAGTARIYVISATEMGLEPLNEEEGLIFILTK